MEGFNQERRGLFDGLKVPFDVNAILLATAAVIMFVAGVWGIELLSGDQIAHNTLLDGMIRNARTAVMNVARPLPGVVRPTVKFSPFAWIGFFGWGAAVWAFFSGAICRIAAMKIAREEGLEIKDALRFAASKFVPNLLSIGFVLAIVGFFYVICNATLAGWVGAIPYVGELLVGVLFFLVLLSSFFIVFAAVLGVLGFNLAAAAIATEASDTFDGVSRAWNYILARPWQVILTYSLTVAYMVIFLFCAHLFEKVSLKSLSLGWWGMGARPQIAEISEETAKAVGGVKQGQRIAIPGKAEFLYKRLFLKDPAFNASSATGTDVLYYPQFESDGVTPIYDAATNRPLQSPDADKDPTHSRDNRLNVWPALPGTLVAASWMVWAWLGLAKLLIAGYLLSYFFSAMTKIYFLLRKDVEGDDYTEINLEDEDEDEEGFDYGETAEKKDAPKAPEEKKALPIVAGSASPEKKDEHGHKH